MQRSTTRLDGMHREQDVRAAIDDFNLRVKEARRQLLGGPPVVTQLRDPDHTMRAWRERRLERAPVPLKSRSDSVPKRRHWVGANDAAGAARLGREADRRTTPRHPRRRAARARPSRRPVRRGRAAPAPTSTSTTGWRPAMGMARRHHGI